MSLPAASNFKKTTSIALYNIVQSAGIEFSIYSNAFKGGNENRTQVGLAQNDNNSSSTCLLIHFFSLTLILVVIF
jgi:hypothetical protein